MLRTNTSTIQQRLQIELNKKLTEYAERSGSKTHISSATVLSVAGIGGAAGTVAPGIGNAVGCVGGAFIGWLACRVKTEYESRKIHQAQLVITDLTNENIARDRSSLHNIVVKAINERRALLEQIKVRDEHQLANIIEFFTCNIIKAIKNTPRLANGAIDEESVVANLGDHKSKKIKSHHLEVNEGELPLTLDELLLNKRSIVGANQWLASRWGRRTSESSSIENLITGNSVSRSTSISENDAKILSPANS